MSPRPGEVSSAPVVTVAVEALASATRMLRQARALVGILSMENYPPEVVSGTLTNVAWATTDLLDRLGGGLNAVLAAWHGAGLSGMLDLVDEADRFRFQARGMANLLGIEDLPAQLPGSTRGDVASAAIDLLDSLGQTMVRMQRLTGEADA